jgi:hypothetical protein
MSQVEVEPHLLKTVSAVTEYELRPLTAALLQRLVQLDGPALVGQMFPVIAKNWCEPFETGWKPYA